MSLIRTCAPLALVLALLSLLAGCAPKQLSASFRFTVLPGAPSRPGLHPEEGMVTLFGSSTLTLRHLGGPDWSRYLAEVVGQAEDPFAPVSPGAPDTCHVFLLTIENNGSDPLLISPGFAMIKGKGGKTSASALDRATLTDLLAANPAYSEQLASRIHPGTTTVNPGRQHAKLLVFQPLAGKPKTVEVVIPSVNVGHASADAVFPFSVHWE